MNTISRPSTRSAAVLLSWACALAGPAAAQSSNQIVAVSPSTASQGTSGLSVTFTLDSDSPPPPPAGVDPSAVSIGTLSGSSVTHASQYQVTAVVSIPADEPVGAKDCTVSFSTPNGTLSFSATGAFTVTALADTPPAIAQQPPSRTLRAGATLSLTVVATGSAPLAFQWQKDEVELAGADAATLTLSPVTAADAGGYRCVVSNPFGSASSDTAVLSVDTSPPTAATSFLVVDSGQISCYDAASAVACPAAGQAFHGQDAQHQGFPPAYTVSGDGLTVADATTGLSWQQSPDTTGDGVIDAADKMTWAAALARPAALNAAGFGGFSDWRLPTIKELYSLIDFRGTDPSGLAGDDTAGLVPFIASEVFAFAYGDTAAGERIIDAQYASSTAYAADANKVFGVNFADGRIKGYDTTMPDGSEKTFLVQCVRGNPNYGANLFVANGDGTITDLATDLMWSADELATSVDWASALALVASHNGAAYLGYSDWRLPNAKELESLFNSARSPDSTASAAIDPLFSSTAIVNEGGELDYPCSWTSTTHATFAGSGAAAAYVCFGRALGWMQEMGASCYSLVDVHGAGAQRSDPKSGGASGYYLGSACSGGSAYGHGPQGDVIRTANAVRLVRGGNGPLVVSVVASPASPASGAAVTFTATASGALSPFTYVWDLAGSAAEGEVVVGSFAAAGAHAVTVTVTDAAGFVATAATTVTVGWSGDIFVDGFEDGGTSAWSS